LCARTTKPFYLTPSKNPYELNVAIWANSHVLRDLKGMLRLLKLRPNIIVNPLQIKRWNELGKHLFDNLLESESGGVFHFFGHAWQVEKRKGWKKLENLLNHIAFRKNIKYVTMSDYVRSTTFINS
jgi:hypothetical protein